MASDAVLIAFGVIQLEALSENRELVPVLVMGDRGTNSTLYREGLTRPLRLHGRSQTLRINGVSDSALTDLQAQCELCSRIFWRFRLSRHSKH